MAEGDPTGREFGEMQAALEFIRDGVRNIESRLASMCINCPPTSSAKDHESRLRRIELALYGMVGILGFIKIIPLIGQLLAHTP